MTRPTYVVLFLCASIADLCSSLVSLPRTSYCGFKRSIISSGISEGHFWGGNLCHTSIDQGKVKQPEVSGQVLMVWATKKVKHVFLIAKCVSIFYKVKV